MPISVACPTCGTKLKAPDNAVGKKVKCPKCASLVVVPAESDEAASAISNAPAPAPKPTPRAEEPEEIEDIPEASDEPIDDGDDEEADEDEEETTKAERGKRRRKRRRALAVRSAKTTRRGACSRIWPARSSPGWER